MSKVKPKEMTREKSTQIENILNRRTVNLSGIQLTQSETNLLRKGLNFCPTPLPPGKYEISKDIDAFARRLTLKEYHTPENIEDVIDGPGYQPSILQKLNQKERKVYTGPSREPYLNTYIDKLRQEISDETLHNLRSPRNNLTKRERAALFRLSNNTDIIIKPADKGGATVIMNAKDYVKEAKRQLDNEEYYKRVGRDLTLEHEQLINQSLDTLMDDGELEEEVAKLLRPAQSRTPIFYMLPKIHKVNNPGRPVVSSVNSHTEKLSAYVDEFLRPIAEKLPSYIQDTTHFIERIRSLGKLPEKCYLATLDVSSLYTNIDTDEGLTIVEEELGKTNQNKPSPMTLSCLLEKVLKLNNFTFGNEHYIQIKGTAMGTRVAPNFANVYMGRLEERFVYQTEWMDHIILWVRFIDDIFLIWKSDKDSLINFINYLNSVAPSIKFTHEISAHSVNFLDTTVLKDNQGNISTDVYQKPTDTHPYLHWTSAHPPHLKRSIPYSQALRLRRICSSTDTLKKRIREYSDFFVACGYAQRKVLHEMQKVLTLTQEECLQTKEREPTDRIPLVTTFNPHTTFIAEIAKRNWNFLKSKERLSLIFNKPPLVAYRRPKSLRDRLVRSRFVNETPQNLIPKGCRACERTKCSWCKKINQTTTFTSPNNNKTYTIFHTVDCQSSWIIYIIECNICKLQYIGKSETAFNLRLNNHRNHIKKGVSSCELTEHFLHNKRTHDFNNNVTITIIEQIRKDHLETDKKKEVLREREIFWQRTLNSFQPYGLNKRTG